MVSRRASAVVVMERGGLGGVGGWGTRGFVLSQVTKDAVGASATPISADGYFLTAAHVLAHSAGRQVLVSYGHESQRELKEARVVWCSEGADLALLHIPLRTDDYYRWSPAERWLPEGTRVIHGGLATGATAAWGKLGSSLAPQGGFTGARKFKIDIPLQPGDSGGPVVDAYGALVGINSAVEYLVPIETAFFVDSEASRPNVQKIQALIEKDRGCNRRVDHPVE